MDIWVVSNILSVMNYAAMSIHVQVFMYKSVCEYTFAFLLGVYLGVELLGYMVNLCLITF